MSKLTSLLKKLGWNWIFIYLKMAANPGGKLRGMAEDYSERA